MTSNGRSSESRRAGRSVGQWLLGLLIVLALAASVLMVFTDQLSITGSLAVIAALWAAVIGAILVTKFRRQADAAESKSRDLRLVYELQLEREIAARRQYELDVESTIRKEIRDESNVELADLKAQVLALRSSLEMLLGEPLPDSRVALPNERLRELASGIGQSHRHGGDDDPASRFGITDDSAVAARDFAATAPAPDSGRRESGYEGYESAGRGSASGINPNEMTEVIPIISDDAPISGRIATEVPAEEIDDEVVEAVAVPEPQQPETRAWAPFEPSSYGQESPTAKSAEVEETAGAEYVEADPVATVPSSTGSQVPPVVFGDDTPTDQWPAQYVGGESHAPEPDTESPAPAESGAYGYSQYQAQQAAEAEAGHLAYGAVPSDSPLRADTPDTPSDDESEASADVPESVEQQPSFAGLGRHEGGDAAQSVPGRRRRRAEDDDNAHSAGLPVSELLSQLRQSQSQDAGRRRRND